MARDCLADRSGRRRVTDDPLDGARYVELQVTNLLNSDDTAARYAENFGVGAVFNSPVPPRQVIGRVGFNF